MGYTKNEPRTFDLKLSLHSDDCAKRVKKCVKKIEGVDSVEIIDQEQGKVRISGNVDSETVIKTLKEKEKKHAELLGKEEESPPKPVSEFVVQLVALLLLGIIVINYIWRYQLVALLLLGIIVINYISPTKPDREFGDQRKVAKTPPVHDCYLAHDHKLEPKSYNDPFKCRRCKEDGFTLGYRCKLCVYDIHKECMNPKPKITHELFPGSTFEFREKPLECRRICDECDNYRRICDACGTRIYGCSYHCEVHDWDLHPRCGNLPKQLRSDGMDLVLISKNVKERCFWCKEKLHSQLAEKKVPGWWYVSEPKEVYCHVYCVFQIVLETWKRGALVRNDDDDDNDGTSKALVKVNLKHVAKSNGSGGRGGRSFSKMLTAILKIIVGALFGDPTGLIVLAAEFLQN